MKITLVVESGYTAPCAVFKTKDLAELFIRQIRLRGIEQSFDMIEYDLCESDADAANAALQFED